MISGWLIYSSVDIQKNQSYIDWFIYEAKQQDVNLKLIVREDLNIGITNNTYSIAYKNKQINLPTFAVVRAVEPLLNMHLELLGLSVFNSFEVSSLCNHKMKTYYEMSKLGIPIIDTLMIKRKDLSTIAPMPYPFVIKEATGRGGDQVHFIENDRMWKEVLVKFTSEDLVVQSTDVQKGKDLRVFVIGKGIVGSVLRESKGDFRANYSLGGTATAYTLSSDEKALIKKIIYAYNFDLVGIDFLIGHNSELILNEIEDVVGSRILSAVSDVNLLKKYVTHIKKQLSLE